MNVLMYLASLGMIKLRDSFTPRTGVERLLPASIDAGTLAVLEPSVIVDSTNVKVYFTKSTGDSTNAICLATCSTITGTWTINPSPIIGLGAGGAPSGRQAHSSDVFKVGSYYYCTATNGYGYTGEDRNIYLYRSTDGINFTDLGLLIDKSTIGVSGFGNSSVYPVLVNGKYEMLVDAWTGVWKIYRFQSTNIESGWTFVNEIPSLQVVTGAMYGGMQHLYINGKWHIVYHYGSVSSGNLPTILAYATSNDLVTCELKETPMFEIETDPYGGGTTDQIADPFIFESGGKTYMLAEYCKNYGGFRSQLWLWESNLTLTQLLK